MQEDAARKHIQEIYKADSVKDVEMTLQVRRGRARVVYVPGYLINYSYGTTQSGSIEILHQYYTAMVPAAGTNGHVVSERHISPHKAQLLAAACTVSSSTLINAMTSTGHEGWSWASILSVDVAFYTFLAVSAAGVIARSCTSIMRQQHASRVDNLITKNELRYACQHHVTHVNTSK